MQASEKACKAAQPSKRKREGDCAAKPGKKGKSDADGQRKPEPEPSGKQEDAQPFTFKSPLEEYPVHILPIPSATKPACTGLREPETYVKCLTSALLDRLSLQEQQAVMGFLTHFGQELSLASVCAGTDSPRMVFDTVVKVVVERLGRMKPEEAPASVQAFTSEISENKQLFLKEMYAGAKEEKLFGDVRLLSNAEAPDHSEKPAVNSQVPAFKVLVGGFPCKDVSACNNQRRKHQHGIMQKNGKTGGAFGGILGMINAHGEELVFSLFENVIGLGTPPMVKATEDTKQKGTINESNLAAALSMLDTEVGQFAFACQLDPRCFAGAQSRARYWMPAFSRKVLAKLEMSELEAYQWTTQFLTRFNDHGFSTIDDVLLPNSHPAVKEHLHQAGQKACPWEEKALDNTAAGHQQDAKWPEAHVNQARSPERRFGFLLLLCCKGFAAVAAADSRPLTCRRVLR